MSRRCLNLDDTSPSLFLRCVYISTTCPSCPDSSPLQTTHIRKLILTLTLTLTHVPEDPSSANDRVKHSFRHKVTMCLVMTTEWSCKHWTRHEIRRCDFDHYINNEFCRLRWQSNRRDDKQCPDCEALSSMVADFAKIQASSTPKEDAPKEGTK